MHEAMIDHQIRTVGNTANQRPNAHLENDPESFKFLGRKAWNFLDHSFKILL